GDSRVERTTGGHCSARELVFSYRRRRRRGLIPAPRLRRPLGSARSLHLVEQWSGRRPFPAFELPVRSFDRHCRRMTAPNPYRGELPTIRRIRIMAGRDKARFHARRKCHVELVERQGEAVPPRLQVGFFSRPAGKKSGATLRLRKRGERAAFSWRKEARCD